MTDDISYQVAYLWKCPYCGADWQRRHRPRGNTRLVCAASAEQRCMGNYDDPAARLDGCGYVGISSGRRGGIAPNLTV